MDTKISNNITMKFINDALVDCPDIIRKKVYIDNQHEAFFLYIKELTDNTLIQHDFISPLAVMSLEQLSNEINIHNITCGEMTITIRFNYNNREHYGWKYCFCLRADSLRYSMYAYRL